MTAREPRDGRGGVIAVVATPGRGLVGTDAGAVLAIATLESSQRPGAKRVVQMSEQVPVQR